MSVMTITRVFFRYTYELSDDAMSQTVIEYKAYHECSIETDKEHGHIMWKE